MDCEGLLNTIALNTNETKLAIETLKQEQEKTNQLLTDLIRVLDPNYGKDN